METNNTSALHPKCAACGKELKDSYITLGITGISYMFCNARCGLDYVRLTFDLDKVIEWCTLNLLGGNLLRLIFAALISRFMHLLMVQIVRILLLAEAVLQFFIEATE